MASSPRFAGAANYELTPRHSFASSRTAATAQPNYGGNGEYASSTYALHEPKAGFSNYSDGPIPSSPGPADLSMKRQMYEGSTPKAKSRKKFLILLVVAILLIAVAVGGCLWYFVFRKKDSTSGSTSTQDGKGSGTGTSDTKTADGAVPTAKAPLPTTGGTGSTVTTADGTTFTYENNFGGYWYFDPNDPFNNGARAQSWTPALNQTFKYGTDQIRGVNIGGWLNTEPFIVPALYEKYSSNNPPPEDEWGLCEAMRADVAGGGIGQMEEHYKTFITEKDFAEIAAAGLNWVRIPIGWWAIETRPGEPFLEKVSWQYFLKAIEWSRKYGLRINLDLHAIPGSQNGWNHSGKGRANIGWLGGPMGYANAQRALDYIRIIAEFISQPQYKDVVPMFGILNEPRTAGFGVEGLRSFYAEAYRIIRNAGGTGEGKGPWISLHDGFNSRASWNDFMRGADRLTLDTHPYRCFGGQSDQPMAGHVRAPCEWAQEVAASTNGFGLTNAGEWSNAVNDCGLFLNGVGLGTRYEGTFIEPSPRIGSCSEWTDYARYTPEMKRAIMGYSLSTMDALKNYFFWTWKIGNSLVSGKVETPAWSYQLGLKEGWMPPDPRTAEGACGAPAPVQPFPAWHTGGTGAGQIAETIPWPPANLRRGPIADLPAYTPTGAIVTLPGPTFTITSAGHTTTADAGSGWANPADRTGMAVPIATCQYPDPWILADAPLPTPCR